jgi:hypothetical protein
MLAQHGERILQAVDGELTTADMRCREIVSGAARRMLTGFESPYDVGMRLMGDLLEVLTTADFSSDSVRDYLARWDDWPESVRAPG